MKVVINECFGGFSLSHKAVMRLAEMRGVKLYAFCYARDADGNFDLNKYVPYEDGQRSLLVHYCASPLKSDGSYDEEAYWSERDVKRDDPLLVRAVEELGLDANGECAQLKIVEIPDGIEYEIQEYDGVESIHEVHRSWS